MYSNNVENRAIIVFSKVSHASVESPINKAFLKGRVVLKMGSIAEQTTWGNIVMLVSVGDPMFSHVRASTIPGGPV